MRTVLIAVVSASWLLAAVPPVAGAGQRIELKDGTMLYIDDRGNMRMVDTGGHVVYMREGEAMVTMDGQVITMNNSPLQERLWRNKTLNPKFF